MIKFIHTTDLEFINGVSKWVSVKPQWKNICNVIKEQNGCIENWMIGFRSFNKKDENLKILILTDATTILYEDALHSLEEQSNMDILKLTDKPFNMVI